MRMRENGGQSTENTQFSSDRLLIRRHCLSAEQANTMYVGGGHYEGI